MPTLRTSRASDRRTLARGDAAAVAPARRLPDRAALAPALAGSLLWWASLPPLGWWPLAWVAMAPWAWVIRRHELHGKRPYMAMWLAGLAYWLATLHWLRLPHPATSVGWVALALYLSIYPPLFVAISRVGVHAWGWPVWLVAPLVWTGLELAQSRLLTGFNMASLAHSQYRWVEVIQISDLAGAYGVTFLVALVGACLAAIPPCDGKRRWNAWPGVVAIVALAAALGYGHVRTNGVATRPGPTVSLVQGATEPEVKSDPAFEGRVFQEYFDLSTRAVSERPDTAALVWPETMFPGEIITFAEGARTPDGFEATVDDFRPRAARNEEQLRLTARRFGRPMIVGIDTWHFGQGAIDMYNSAIAVDPTGAIRARYDKMHPVMFGEYIPFAKYIPWLYTITPLGAGINRGREAPIMDLAGARAVANICFESTLPHMVRRQVQLARASGDEPDVLVNLTNDGWFRGSSELDLHLACGVFRAVECRKPMLIAANTGLSAWIDSNGQVRAQGRRRAADVIHATLEFDDRRSVYLAIGDWPACIALGLAVGMAADGLRRRRRSRRAGREAAQGIAK